jgi:hypothetical protein
MDPWSDLAGHFHAVVARSRRPGGSEQPAAAHAVVSDTLSWVLGQHAETKDGAALLQLFVSELHARQVDPVAIAGASEALSALLGGAGSRGGYYHWRQGWCDCPGTSMAGGKQRWVVLGGPPGAATLTRCKGRRGAGGAEALAAGAVGTLEPLPLTGASVTLVEDHQRRELRLQLAGAPPPAPVTLVPEAAEAEGWLRALTTACCAPGSDGGGASGSGEVVPTRTRRKSLPGLHSLRKAVSKKKLRYQEGGYDLDLTYITGSIIAMGFPSEGSEGMIRNPLEEVVKFLDARHGPHYRVYNLCSERSYESRKFHNRVGLYGFDDHDVPTTELIVRFCFDLGSWLSSSPQVRAHSLTAQSVCAQRARAQRATDVGRAYQPAAAERRRDPLQGGQGTHGPHDRGVPALLGGVPDRRRGAGLLRPEAHGQRQGGHHPVPAALLPLRRALPPGINIGVGGPCLAGVSVGRARAGPTPF